LISNHVDHATSLSINNHKEIEIETEKNESRRHLTHYTKGIPDSAPYRARLTQINNQLEMLAILSELAEKVELEELLSTAEVISLHIPQTAETFNLINDAFFNQWKQAKFLLNFSRGGIVNLSSLISALDRGSLLGVHLDVLPQEKFNPNTNELLLPESEKILYQQVLNHPKIQMSPHIGGWTYRSKTEIENALLNSLQTWMQEKGYTPQ
jgi:phosphoglycerate dehydrogenase-like enzyme